MFFSPFVSFGWLCFFGHALENPPRYFVVQIVPEFTAPANQRECGLRIVTPTLYAHLRRLQLSARRHPITKHGLNSSDKIPLPSLSFPRCPSTRN